MKTILSLCLITALSILLSSCIANKPIQKVKPVNNPSYDVEYLFDYDGCKVYRFYDLGNYVYFTNCSGQVTSISNDSAAKRNTNYIKK